MSEIHAEKRVSSDILRKQQICSDSAFRSLGNQSMLKLTSQESVIQRERYMRAVINEDAADTDIQLLRQLSETTKDYGKITRAEVEKNAAQLQAAGIPVDAATEFETALSIRDLLDGFRGMATSLCIPGVRYIYPVGYQLEITEDSNVLSNYKGDGSTTSGIKVNSLEGGTVIEDLLKKLKETIPLEFDGVVVTGKTNKAIYDSIMDTIINLQTAGKMEMYNLAITIKRTKINDAIKASFKDSGDPDFDQNRGVKSKDQIYGAGVPAKYGESNINGKIADVRLAWYDDTIDDHYESNSRIDAKWKRSNADFIKNRKTSAQNIITKINNATGKILPVKKTSELGT